MGFRFAHMADVHLDAWREPELKVLNTMAFEKAISVCLEYKVDFVIIAGDLFHTSHPDIDILRMAVRNLKRLKDSNIDCYVVPGSHDFSHKEKTMLSVLEEMGLLINVAKARTRDGKLIPVLTEHQKSGTKFFGMVGRKMGLEKDYFDAVDKELKLDKSRFNIFVFHSAITEYKPEFLKNMESISLNSFPKGFDYYAGGHIHDRIIQKDSIGYVAYPGPLYPDNFQELESLKKGSFFIIEVGNNKDINIREEYVKLKDIVALEINLDGLDPQESEEKIMEELQKVDLKDKILLLKLTGTLSSGSSSDIRFKNLMDFVRVKGVYVFKRDISKLLSRDFVEIKIDSRRGVKDIEDKLIEEHLGQLDVPFNEKEIVFKVFEKFDTEKNESENNDMFNDRIIRLGEDIFGE